MFREFSESRGRVGGLQGSGLGPRVEGTPGSWPPLQDSLSES